MDTTGKQGVSVCRGFTCDRPADCTVAGRCLYRPSSDLAREAMAAPSEVERLRKENEELKAELKELRWILEGLQK